MKDAASALRDRLNGDLLSAMKSRDRIATAALRSLMAALDNASAVPMSKGAASIVGPVSDVPRKMLSTEDCRRILAGEARSRTEAAEDYERLGRHHEAAQMRAELLVIEACMQEATAFD